MLIENSKAKEKKEQKKRELICPKCNKKMVVEDNQPDVCPFCQTTGKKLLNEKEN